MNASLLQTFRESTEYNIRCLLDSLRLYEWGVTDTSDGPISLHNTWGNLPMYPGQENLYHLPSFALTLRLLMSYIYIYIYMEHLFLMFLDHTQRRSTVGRTPLGE